MLRYMTSGESHGKGLVSILEGMPKGLAIDISFVNKELKRRMRGYGRGSRMRGIEHDRALVISGLRKGVTLGSPIGIFIENKDYSIEGLASVTRPRPGHADLAGALKYGEKDIRNILERASARDTASRTACGALAKILLSRFNVELTSHVTSIGRVSAHVGKIGFNAIKKLASGSLLNTADKKAEANMKKEIDDAARNGDTLGGTFEVIASGVIAGVGSFMQWDRRLDGNLARAVMSIPGVKLVAIGAGFEASMKRGSDVHDAIYYDKKLKRFFRKTNNAGGLEGGVTNGEEIIVRAAMKPIATLKNALESVDTRTKAKAAAAVERGDVTAVPACSVIAEAVCAIELAGAYLEKFGGDTITEMERNFEGYVRQIRNF